MRPAPAQVLQTAYDFQTVQPHPYVHALGNATVAASGYSGAIGVNPATIGTEGTVRIGSNVNLSRGPVYSSPWNVSPLINSIATPSVTMKRGRWATGVQVKHSDWEDREVRNPQGEVIGTTAFQQSIKGVAAYEVNPMVTVGAGMNLIRSRLPSRFGSGVELHPTLDLGVQYQTQVEKDFVNLRPALGLSMTDFGGNVSYENRPGDLAAPTTIRGGGALNVTSQSKQFGRPEWRIGLYGVLSNLLVSGEFVEENGQRWARGSELRNTPGWRWAFWTFCLSDSAVFTRATTMVGDSTLRSDSDSTRTTSRLMHRGRSEMRNPSSSIPMADSQSGYRSPTAPATSGRPFSETESNHPQHIRIVAGPRLLSNMSRKSFPSTSTQAPCPDDSTSFPSLPSRFCSVASPLPPPPRRTTTEPP